VYADDGLTLTVGIKNTYLLLSVTVQRVLHQVKIVSADFFPVNPAKSEMMLFR